MVGLALEEGVFAEGRRQLDDVQATPALSEPPEAPQQEVAASNAPPPIQEQARLRLAPEATMDLLRELTVAFGDPMYQQQIYKLARDVRMDRKAFLDNLRKVALPFQRHIVERYGFAPTLEGVSEMKRAVGD